MKRLVLIVVATALAISANAQSTKKTKAAEPKKNLGLIGSSVDKSSQGANYGMSGCGLGSVLFGETESRGGQILSSTTNGFYSNNTFGMSSGTSNCVPERAAHTAAVKRNVEMFVAANREALANDIVKMDGETVATVSEIMGCKDQAYLGSKLQSRYENIFNTKEEKGLANNIYNTVANDRYLVENCNI